jgi:hypothetical protein
VQTPHPVLFASAQLRTFGFVDAHCFRRLHRHTPCRPGRPITVSRRDSSGESQLASDRGTAGESGERLIVQIQTWAVTLWIFGKPDLSDRGHAIISDRRQPVGLDLFAAGAKPLPEHLPERQQN